jgi:hypothetical protein
MLLKISTAQTVVIGPILDADGAAVTTAIVTNISLAKNGSAAALTTETLTHLANGYYTLALTSGNTNTLGSLEVFANNTAMSMTVFRYNVIAAQVYDSIVSGTDLLQIDIQQLVGSAQDAARILIGANSNHEVQVTGSNHVAADIHELQAGVITAADFAAGAITSTVLATDSITSSQIAASAVTELQSGLATSNGVTAAFTEIKGAGWSSGTDTLEEIADAVAAISTGNGTGARTVTVTVNDGTTALQNAKVRMTSGAETYTALTNVSGVCTFNLNDATWVVSITRNGYSFSGTTLVVDGTETVTYSMSLVTITPSSSDKVTGYWTVLNENGVEAASVVVTIKARQPLRGGAGVFHDAGERTATSNVNGLVQFTNLIPGWRYAVVANDDYVADFVVPADAVTSVELGSIVARLP